MANSEKNIYSAILGILRADTTIAKYVPTARVFDGLRDTIPESAIPCIVLEPKGTREQPATLNGRAMLIVSTSVWCIVKSFTHASGVLGQKMTVTSGTNNKINFTENGGAELTATLAAGSYEAGATSADAGTLCAAIKTAMDAAGTAAYTVTYSYSTNKFTITRASGVFVLLWSTGTNTSTAAYAVMGFSKADTSSAIAQTSDSFSAVLRGILDLADDVKNALKAYQDLNYDTTVARCNYFRFTDCPYSYKNFPYREAEVVVDAYIQTTGAATR